MKKALVLFLSLCLAVTAFGGCSQTEESQSAPSSLSEASLEQSSLYPGRTPKVSISHQRAPESSYPMEVKVNGTAYSLPMKLSDFVDLGWTTTQDKDKTIDAQHRFNPVSFSNNDLLCIVEPVNFDINALPLEQCYLTAMVFDAADLGENDIVALHNGIQLNSSTAEQVQAAYGRPTVYNEEDQGFIKMEYQRKRQQVIRLHFDSESKVLTKIILQNIDQPEDFETGEIDETTPEIVNSYQTPEEISDDFSDFTMEFDGERYKLPMPLYLLEEQGWEPSEDSIERLSGRGSGELELTRDQQHMRVSLRNYSPDATKISNCFVTSLSSGRGVTRVPLTIGNNISFESSKEQLDDLMEKTDSMLMDDFSSSSRIVYGIYPTRSRLDYYIIYFSRDTGKVMQIDISYSPSYAEYIADTAEPEVQINAQTPGRE